MDNTAANQNNLTPLLHLYTRHELLKNHVFGQRLAELVPEKEVALGSSKKVNGQRLGRFDFYVKDIKGKKTGIEILARPSQGKLKEKLAYARDVDEFIFVLPESAMALYRRPGKVFHKNSRTKSLSKEFAAANLFAWLFDAESQRFTAKKRLDKIFCVEKSRR